MAKTPRVRAQRVGAIPTRGELKRTDLLDRLADHMLATGLDASLRPLAAAIGTSDRMLLYYFPDKATLMSAVLERIASRLAAMLGAAVPIERTTGTELTRLLWETVRKPAFRPYMRIWLEMTGYAARGEEPYRAIGNAIASGFIAWIEARLSEPARVRHASATDVLIRIEGMLLLDAFGITVGKSGESRSTR